MKEYSFWISVLSLAIALGLLIWNIYKEFMRPKLKLSLSLSPGALQISATNLGPGNITLINQAALKYKSSYLRKIIKKDPYKFIFVSSLKHIARTIGDYKSLGFPTSMFTLPGSLAVGEADVLNLSHENINSIKEPTIINIGILDSTGRIHWASKKEFRRVKKEFKNIFNNKE